MTTSHCLQRQDISGSSRTRVKICVKSDIPFSGPCGMFETYTSLSFNANDLDIAFSSPTQYPFVSFTSAKTVEVLIFYL